MAISGMCALDNTSRGAENAGPGVEKGGRGGGARVSLGLAVVAVVAMGAAATLLVAWGVHQSIDEAARSRLVVVSGVALSLLVAALVWTMGRSRARAVAWGHAMTADLRRANGELERLALTDKLTGLPNRTLLTDRISQAMARARRNPEDGYALLFVDFDRFKLINDTMGHEAGDALLIQIAARLRGLVRAGDSGGGAPRGETGGRVGGGTSSWCCWRGSRRRGMRSVWRRGWWRRSRRRTRFWVSRW
jgi:Diguanylate cyclase, GGDEF domain